MRYVGLIRNVMVGREGLHREVLLELLAGAGGEHGSSHLSTGNVLFEAPPSRLEAVVGRFEAGIEEVIGRREPVIVRESDWLRTFVAADPFDGFPRDEWECVVAFLPLQAAPLDVADVGEVEGDTVVAVRPHELLTAARYGVRRLGALRILETVSRGRGTSRSWSTVQRLVRVSADIGPSDGR